MPDTRLRAIGLATVGLLFAACTAVTSSPSDLASTGRPDPTIGSVPSATASSVVTSDAPPQSSGDRQVELTQAWATAPLIDVATGEEFRIADLVGKVIILEAMATWCPSCRTQQGAVQEALSRLPGDRVVFVALEVDPNEDAAGLAEYAATNGFAGRYAIAGPDVARALAADFGDQFLNPPSTPMLIVGTDGTVTPTEFRQKSADEIVALAQAHGA